MSEDSGDSPNCPATIPGFHQTVGLQSRGFTKISRYNSGVSPNCPATRQGNFTLLKTSSNFCYDYERDWGWHPCEGFGWERPNFWYIVNLLVCLFIFFFAIRFNLPLLLFIFKFVVVQKPGGHMQQNPLQKRDKKS